MQPNAALLLAALALGASCQAGSSSAPDGSSDASDDGATSGSSDAALDAETDAAGDTGLPRDSGHGSDGSDGSHPGDAATDARPDDATPGDARVDGATLDAGMPDGPLRSFVYVGGADWSGAPYPFRAYALDREALTLSELSGVPSMGANPGYITPSHDGRHLYIANEYGNGGVTVASVDPLTGALANLDFEVGPGGGGFVFTEVSPNGHYVLAASYNGGYVAVYPVKDDATLDPLQQQLDFGGSAQSHCVRVHPNGQYAFVPNKGLNSVAQLRMDPATGALSHNSGDGQPAAYNAPTGPRHIALSKGGDRAFLIEELSNDVRSLSVKVDGTLDPLDTKPRLPPDFTGDDSGAHILLHPNGKYVYASNRGSNTIAVFSIDAASGTLTPIEFEPTRGSTPRNFDIDVAGEILVVANQDSGSLAVFAIEADGSLTPVGEPITGLLSPQAVSIVSFPQTM